VRVLLVDNSQCIHAVVTAMLEDYGATVTALATADEALELLERERPDVLVSALAMPDKGGYWLIGRVRDIPPERGGRRRPPLSRGSPVLSTGPASCAGVQYHIEKPVTADELSGIVALLALKAPSPPQD
jgi:CheY-like chemotaxis protein